MMEPNQTSEPTPGRSFLSKWRFLVLLLIFVLAAVPLGVWGWWRYRVYRAIETTIGSGPDFRWQFDPLGSARKEDLFYLLSDYSHTMDRLVNVALNDPADSRRIHAIAAIKGIPTPNDSFTIRQEHLPRLISLATDSALSPAMTDQLMDTLADWIPKTGASASERQKIRERIDRGVTGQRLAWIYVLDSIGGKDETLQLLGYANEPDGWLNVYNSRTRFSLWPGAIPFIEKWLQDEYRREASLDFAVLALSESGRAVLRKFVLDESFPSTLRTKGIEKLTETIAGGQELHRCIESPSLANSLTRLLNVDVNEWLQTRLKKLEEHRGEELWKELIAGLDPGYWGTTHTLAEQLPEELEHARVASVEKKMAENLACLRALAMQPTLTTQIDWQKWKFERKPGIRSQQELLTLIVHNPQLIDAVAIRRRVIPDLFGYVPNECIPFYLTMLRSRDSRLSFYACWALVTYSENKEALDFAIDCLEQGSPGENVALLAILQRRFAVNYFWDAAAWREWARKPRLGE